MRRYLILALTVFAAFAPKVIAADEPWFDIEKCAFCKQLAAQPGLLKHMRTEYHDLKNGVMSVTYVDKEYEGEFAKAREGMKPVVADIMAGKQVPMCKHCSTLGSFYEAGVVPETIKSEKCTIVVYTSADPATVAKLQDFGKKSNEALAQFRKKQGDDGGK